LKKLKNTFQQNSKKQTVERGFHLRSSVRKIPFCDKLRQTEFASRYDKGGSLRRTKKAAPESDAASYILLKLKILFNKLH